VVLVLLGGATGIGIAPLLVRWSQVGPSATAFYRLLFALPLLWAWSHVQLQRDPTLQRPHSGRDFGLLAAAGLLFTADLAMWHWSLRFTSVANSTLLTNLAPLLVTIGAWSLLGERITALFVLGLFAALAGGALLVGWRLESGHLRGDLLAVSTAVFYAGYLLLIKILRRKFSTAAIMAWSGLFSCPGFLLVAVLSREQLLPGSAQGWWVLLGLAMISHVGGQTLIAFAIGHLPASFSALSLLWQPVVAAVLAWWWLGEAMVGHQLAGGLLILAGIALAHGGQSRAPAANSA
jgi:drug/metabolite transporter (DMT)-like permease